MSVSLQYAANLSVTEVLENNTAPYAEANRKVVSTQFNSGGNYNAGSTPAVSAHAASQQALTAGAATIDLTALTGANGVSVDMTGKKIEFVKLIAAADNGAAITVEPGAANGYNLFGASFAIVLQPGQEITVKLAEGAPDVGATAKEIDLSGTGDDSLSYVFIGG